ncbi:MAG: LysR family transcriptional regulator [Pyramidobacter sp.]|nr:LysR family transcriptional regulator [Pyramidobacter sp.]
MDFRELNYVIAISEHGTISKAADALHIAQPSLSKFLQNLEGSLGVKLFEHVSRRMKLTAAGEEYVKTAYRIRAIGGELQNSMNDYARLRKGALSIGSTNARSKYVMVNTLPQFKRLYPGFCLNVSEEPLDELERDLRAGVIDLALYTVKKRGSEFAYHHICAEEVVLAMSPDNPHAGEGQERKGLRRPWIDLKRLNDQPFLLPPEIWRVSRVGSRLLYENGMNPEIVHMGSVEAAVAVVSRGLGVCFCSSMMEQCFEGERKPIYFSVGEPVAEVEFVVAARKTMPLTQAVRDYIAIVRSVFGDGT